MDTNSKLLKLSCEACSATFHTVLAIERIVNAPCPNCKERKLKVVEDNEKEAIRL